MAPAVSFWKSLSRILNINLTRLEFVKGPPDPTTHHPKKTHLTTVPLQDLHHSKKISDPMHEKPKKRYLSMTHETLNTTEERGSLSNCQHLTEISKRKLLLYIQPRRHTAKPQQFSAANTGDPKRLQNSPVWGNSSRWCWGNPCIRWF